MIRKFEAEDIDEVSSIWLSANVEAHDFIPESYWRENFDMVCEMLPQAELYVYCDDSTEKIAGFIGMNEEHIEGIFVKAEMRSNGIGKALLNFAKTKKERLSLNVYQKNSRAVSFYEREGFIIKEEGLDEETGEKDFLMTWKK